MPYGTMITFKHTLLTRSNQKTKHITSEMLMTTVESGWCVCVVKMSYVWPSRALKAWGNMDADVLSAGEVYRQSEPGV